MPAGAPLGRRAARAESSTLGRPAAWKTCEEATMPLQEVNDHFYTISDEKRRGAMNKYDYSDEGNEGWVLPAQRAGTTPLWRLWSEAGTNHFYTISDEQRDGAIKKYGYRLEGHEGFVF